MKIILALFFFYIEQIHITTTKHTMTMRSYIWLVCLTVIFASCKDMIQYSPMEVRLDEEMTNLNYKNIIKIQSQPTKDTFKFILIGDSQRFYEEMELFVNAVNKRSDISFIFLAGDISDFGTNREYKWIYRSLSKLNAPFIGIIGNHDMLGNGRRIYSEMFGAENFSFDYSGRRFICLNTNSREVGFDGSIPDMPWLQQELGHVQTYKSTFVLSHIPPFDGDFDKSLESSYASFLSNNNVKLSLHGHQHTYSSSRPYEDGVEYLVCASMQKRNYVVITVTNDTYTTEQVFY